MRFSRLFALSQPLHRLAAAAALATVLAAPAQAGQVFADQAPSAALGRDVKFTVYVPDGYQAGGSVTYPVVYLLHGAGGDENEWRTKGGAVETLDGLIKRGLIRPSVVVMPTTGPASWWADGAAEKAGTAIMKDLLPYVESRYRVQKERSGRAIGGLSMGGYGALNLSLRNPAQFCAAAVISPAIYDPLPPETSASRRTPQFVRNGQFDAETWKSLNYAAVLDTYKAGAARVMLAGLALFIVSTRTISGFPEPVTWLGSADFLRGDLDQRYSNSVDVFALQARISL